MSNSVSTINDSQRSTGRRYWLYEAKVDDVGSVRLERNHYETFGGPGGQLTRSVQEVYAPGLEVNSEYFEDQYSACRYSAAIDGDAFDLLLVPAGH